MSLPRRLPATHRFPGGFKVRIELVPRGEGGLEDGDHGLYFTESYDCGVIRLWDGLTPRQRWNVLMHELLHALVDAQNYVEVSR